MKILKIISLGCFLSLFFVFQGIAQITGAVSTDISKTKYRENSVVYIDYVGTIFSPPLQNPVINQLGLRFTPHVLPIVVGTTVEFLNSDDVLHNVFSPDSCSERFNLGTWPKNESNTRKFEKIGCESVLLCYVHPDMEAYIIVLQNPFFSVTDKEGNFKIDNMPPGNYTLRVWNEKLMAEEKQVTVPEKGTVHVNFDLIKN